MKRVFAFLLIVASVAGVWSQTLNVASYNIRLHSQADYAGGDGWTQRRDAMCDVVRFMAFDVWGAQEVCHDQLVDILDRLPEYDYVGVGRDDGAEAGEYSPVFFRRDRFDVLASGTFWLSETPDSVSYGWDANCRRVCSWAHLKDMTTGKDFWFFNTHMDHIGVVARAEGAKLLVERIGKMCGDHARVILTGDFNVAQNSQPYNVLAQSELMADAYNLAPVRFAPSGTFNNFDVKRDSDKRIDHIFVGKGIDVERYGILTFHYWRGEDSEDTAKADVNRCGRVHLQSDHYPVQIIVSLK